MCAGTLNQFYFITVVMPDMIREQPDETSPVIQLVEGRDLDITLGQCQPSDIEDDIENIADGIAEDARDDVAGNRNCEIDAKVAISTYGLPPGRVGFSIK